MKFFFKACICFLSLSVTPFIILASPAIALYLDNQSFFTTARIVWPFVVTTLAFIIAATILHIFSSFRILRFLLWFYLLSGPVFLLYTFLRKIPLAPMELQYTAFFFLLFGLIVAWFLEKRLNPSHAFTFFAIFGAVLLAGDLYQYARKKVPYVPPPRVIGNDLATLSKPGKRLPNIYHLVFDEFQTDMFVQALSDRVKGDLGGFTFFPENMAVYGRTAMSLASIYSGRKYDPATPQTDYQREAFTSNKSILSSLKEGGYATYGYLPLVFTFDPNLFSYRVNAAEQLDSKPQNAVFKKLWLYANFPSFVSRWFLDEQELNQMKNRNFLVGTTNIASYLSFIKFIDEEKLLPDHNRYTYVHILLPHFPNIFHSDCTYNADMQKTSIEEQTACATLLITDFARTLKNLDHFKESLIIVGGDHGSFYDLDKPDSGAPPSLKKVRPVPDSTEWIRARSRALLLVKPAGVDADEAFKVSEVETTLLDIAPTIADSAELKTSIEFEGFSLLRHSGARKSIPREFYFFAKKGEGEWTDKMDRYLITQKKVEGPEQILLTNNPR